MTRVYRFRIVPKTAFASPLRGDMLFGQLCWMLRWTEGEARLKERLAGYGASPFLVVSDAFPAGYLPLPLLPSAFWEQEDADPKVLKARRWIARSETGKPLAKWLHAAKSASELGNAGYCQAEALQFHNSINRATGSTGEAPFAPYSQNTLYYGEGALEIYAQTDEALLDIETLSAALSAVGDSGYGRDASVGLGKFAVEGAEEVTPDAASPSKMILSAACLEGMKLEAASFYKTATHFGRHGSVLSHPNPFKKPVVLAQTGSVLTSAAFAGMTVVGRAVTGISPVQPEAVHQGYALAWPLALKTGKEEL
jgi:CRISPR-associated protein Csm4